MSFSINLEFGGSEKGRSLISAYRSLAITMNTPGFKKLSTAQLWDRSQTTLLKFCPLLTTYLPTYLPTHPLLTLVRYLISLLFIRENLHIVHTPSTSYLPCVVNIVRERPLFAVDLCIAIVVSRGYSIPLTIKWLGRHNF